MSVSPAPSDPPIHTERGFTMRDVLKIALLVPAAYVVPFLATLAVLTH